MIKKLHLNTAKRQFQKTQQKDKLRTALNIQSKTMNQNKSKPNSFQCQLCSSFYTTACDKAKAAKVFCTRFCSKATKLHSPIMWAESSKLASFSLKGRFTDNFGIIPEPFPALSTLDPEALYIKGPSNCIWTQENRNFRKDNRKTNPELHWIFRPKWWLRTSPNLIHFKVKCDLHSPGLAVNMQSG